MEGEGDVRARGVRLASLVAVALLVLAGCGDDAGDDADPGQVDSMEAPELGACRVLTPEDVDQRSNATKTVDCEERHTAETFAIGELPDELHDVDYDVRGAGRLRLRDLRRRVRDVPRARTRAW